MTNVKPRVFENERECRFVARDAIPKGAEGASLEFCPQSILSVTFGCNMDNQSRKTFERLFTNLGLTEFKTAKIHEKSYTIEVF